MRAMPVNHPDRPLPLVGASNFRDLGGYTGQDGLTVRWRQLFRSDHLGGLTTADQAALQRLAVTRVIDFRGLNERATEPNRLPDVLQVSLAIEPTVVQRMQDLIASGETLTVPVVTDLMADLYRALVQHQSHRYTAFFQELLHADGPVVFHCTAGKDRTGFAAALFLLALGVPRDVVVQDYLLTNSLYRRPLQAQTGGIPSDALAVLWRVQTGFLDAAFDAVNMQHGSLDAYLEDALKLGPAERRELAARYLAQA